MEKSGLEFFILKFTEPLKVAAAQFQKTCPERLHWPGRLARISEGAQRISKQKILYRFSPSFASQK